MRIRVTIQKSRFITKQYFPDGERRVNRDLLTCPLFSLEREGIQLWPCIFRILKLKKDFKGNSVFGFTERVLKEFEEI